MILLVGTVHQDPEGEAKLKKILEASRPETICLEFSLLSLYWRWLRGEELQQRLTSLTSQVAKEKGMLHDAAMAHPEILAIKDLLRLPFEYCAAMDYCRQNVASLLFMEDFPTASRRLQFWERELITKANIETLLQAPRYDLNQKITESYQTAASLLRAESSSINRPLDLPSEIASLRIKKNLRPRREQRVAGKLSYWASRAPERKICYICGWEHLVEYRGAPSLAAALPRENLGKVILEPGCVTQFINENPQVVSGAVYGAVN